MDTPKELLCGAVLGMVGKTIEFPFDTVKVRLQSSRARHSTLELIASTYRDEGLLRGFYQGLRAPLVGACLENAVLFATYNHTLGLLNAVATEKDTLQLKALSGASAGFMASFVLTPVELVKCQLQVRNLVALGPAKHLYADVIRQTVQKNGVLGLWKGLGLTLLREVNGTAIWFCSYEVASDYFTGLPDGVKPLVCGAIAGVTFNFTTFPVDTVKSNIQTGDVLGSESAVAVVRRLGLRRLYSGLGITLLRSVPANAMIFYSYEALRRWLSEP